MTEQEILKEESRYINLYHGMELEPNINQPNQRGNENGILFYVMYLLLKEINGILTEKDCYTFEEICKNLEVEPGLYDRGANEDETIPVEERRSISQDNITAISSFSYFKFVPPKRAEDIAKYGLKHFFIYNNIKPRLVPPINPANWPTWLYNGGYKLLSIFLLPWTFINLVITCSKEPGITSGKQLNFVELYPVREEFIWKYFWRYYRNKMVKMYGEEWLYEIMCIYYRYPEHPNRVLAKGIKL